MTLRKKIEKILKKEIILMGDHSLYGKLTNQITFVFLDHIQSLEDKGWEAETILQSLKGLKYEKY